MSLTTTQPTTLVQYEQMRAAVEQCWRIDEAADIRDKATALQVYARQRDDRDLENWVSEIRVRASIRVGELVRDIDTAQGARRDLASSHPRSDLPTKAETIASAGLSIPTAYRLEQLTGGRDERAQIAAKEATEHYFAQQRQSREPVTMEGLRAAVKDAVVATVGPRPAPSRVPRAQIEPDADLGFPSFYAALLPLGERDYDPADLAQAADITLIEHFYCLVNDAIILLNAFNAALQAREQAEAAHG